MELFTEIHKAYLYDISFGATTNYPVFSVGAKSGTNALAYQVAPTYLCSRS